MLGMEDVLFIMVVLGLPIGFLVGGCYLLWSGLRADADRLWLRQREHLLSLGVQPVRTEQWEKAITSRRIRSLLAGCIFVAMAVYSTIALSDVWNILF